MITDDNNGKKFFILFGRRSIGFVVLHRSTVIDENQILPHIELETSNLFVNIRDQEVNYVVILKKFKSSCNMMEIFPSDNSNIITTEIESRK